MSFQEFIENYKVRLGKPDHKDLTNFNEAKLDEYSSKLQNLYYQYSVLKLLGETLERKSDLSYIHKPFQQNMNEDIDRFDFLKNILIEESVACISLRPEQLQQIKNDGFEFDRIIENHGEQIINVIGKNVPSFQLKLKEFVKYAENPEKINEILVSRNQLPIVDEFDNILSIIDDLTEWSFEKNRMAELLPELSYYSQHNMLSYLREQISPQVLLKYNGAIGYQKQNLGTTVINFNYGPSDCIWITTDQKHSFDETVDLHQFLKKSITIKIAVQKAGDILILNPNAIHLTRAKGKTMQFQWNFLLKDSTFFKSFFECNQLNGQIPLTTLFMDIYNHEKNNLDNESQNFLRSKLEFLFTKENDKLQQLNTKPPTYRADSLDVIHLHSYKKQQFHRCAKCKGEIFNFFILQSSSYCLNCSETLTQPIELYAKYKTNDLSELINFMNNTCIDSLCYGVMNQNVKCSRRNQIFKQRKTEEIKNQQNSSEEQKQEKEKQIRKSIVSKPEKELTQLEQERYQALKDFFDRGSKQDLLEDIAPKPQTSSKIYFHVLPPPPKSSVIQIKKIQEVLKRPPIRPQVNEELLMTTRKRSKILRKTGTRVVKNLYPRTVYDFTSKEVKKPVVEFEVKQQPSEQIPILKKQKKVDEPPKVDEWQ